jgi:hypothetical protein
MSRWFRLYDELLDDPKVQKLSPQRFREEFLRAIAGKPSAFDELIVGPFVRPPSHEWALIRAEVFERDDYTCCYCGAHGVSLECDHVVPVASGGTHDLDNLKTACKPCNRAKAAKSLEEWRR